MNALQAEERLTLPEPGRTLFRATARTIAHYFEHNEAGPGWTLGGGTILSARWGRHRGSYDLDIMVSPQPAHARLRRSAREKEWLHGLDTAMKAAGATSAEVTAVWMRTYHFPNAQRIELLESLPPIHFMRPVVTEIDGLYAWTQRSDQILAGKLLARGTKSPVRDVFDLAAAARRDPEALANAIGQLWENATVTEMTERWLERREVLGREAWERIDGVGADLIDCKEDPAKEAVRAIRGWAWRGALVERKDDTWEVRTRSILGGERRWRYGNLREAVDRLALVGAIQGDRREIERRRLETEDGREFETAGSGLSEQVGPTLTVNANGSVNASDVGDDHGLVGNVPEAARWAAARGWTEEEEIPSLELTLEKERERAIAEQRARSVPGG